MRRVAAARCGGYIAAGLMLLLGGCATEPSVGFVQGIDSAPMLLAHRGVAQRYDMAGVSDSTCTASRIDPPTHAILENTLASIAASIEFGASVVEIDVHPTTDGEFAVFHDWTLECRTNGSGRTRDQTMSYLKTLDIGHGYTADGGRSFPFRGKALGQMPSLREVLVAFPMLPLLINIKSRDPAEGARMAAFLAELTEEDRRRLAVYGAAAPIDAIRRQMPSVSVMSRESLKSCLLRYMLIGWSGAIPKRCERSLVVVPLNYAGWLWGWPNVFVERMESVGTPVFIMRADHGGASRGIDSLAELEKLPPGFRGGIWTDEIEMIGGALGLGARSREAAQR